MSKGIIKVIIALSMYWLVQTNALACEPPQNCAIEGEWDIGIALGLGARNNPLVDGETIPNIVLFDVAWYGETLYFDNGEFGFKWHDSDALLAESYVTLDRENIFFELWHPANFTVNVSAPSVPDNIPDSGNSNFEISKDDVATRKWAVNVGSRIHYYFGDYEATFSLETDISSVHQGHKAELSLERLWKGNNWNVRLRPSVTWKSDNHVNYYYGVTSRDTDISALLYEAKGGFQPGVSLSYTRTISPQWYWVANASYRKLHDSMTKSPLVDKSNVASIFIGVGYRF